MNGGKSNDVKAQMTDVGKGEGGKIAEQRVGESRDTFRSLWKNK